MTKYVFLTEEWIAQAKSIREASGVDDTPPAHAMRMNQIVTEVPFGEGEIKAHIDTSEGELKMDLGHIENPDLTVTLDYATAKAILVEGNPQVGMQAFMAGKIKVDGDITKLMAMQAGATDPAAVAAALAIHEMTE